MNDEITTTVGRQLYSFDGRVLEIFGGYPVRFHIRHMQVRVTDPDRKGRRTVEITAGHPEAPATRHLWTYTAAEWQQTPGLAALLETVRTAIDSGPGQRS